MDIQINFGENPSALPDDLLRMWCIEKAILMKGDLAVFCAQTVSSEAEELYSYIREGVPYEAGWITKNKNKETNDSQGEDQS